MSGKEPRQRASKDSYSSSLSLALILPSQHPPCLSPYALSPLPHRQQYACSLALNQTQAQAKRDLRCNQSISGSPLGPLSSYCTHKPNSHPAPIRPHRTRIRAWGEDGKDHNGKAVQKREARVKPQDPKNPTPKSGTRASDAEPSHATP